MTIFATADPSQPPPPMPLLPRPPRPGRARGRTLVVTGIGVVLFGLAAFVPAARPVLMGLWAVANALAALVVAIWGLFHPRAVLGRAGGAGAALRWAIALTLALALALLLGTALDSVSVRIGVTPRTLPPAVITVVLFAMIPVALLFLHAAGLLGASVGASMGVFVAEQRRGAANSSRSSSTSSNGGGGAAAAVVGVGAWWTVLLAGAFLSATGPARVMGAVALAGVPLLSAAGCVLVFSGRLAPWGRWLRRALRALAHVSIGRSRRLGRPRVLDLRGATLGLFAAGCVLGLSNLRLLQPLQTSWLGAMTQINNELFAWGVRTAEFGRADEEDAPAKPPAPPSQQGRRRARPAVVLDPAARIVLLDLDEPTLHDLKGPKSSEAAVQARVVRKLAGWGAARVVLPAPMLSSDAAHSVVAPRSFAPPPSEDDARRSLRDLPALVAAVRRWPAVVLTVGGKAAEFDAEVAAQKSLRAAAGGRVGRADLERLAGNARVPVVPIRWPDGDPPPAPLLIASGMAAAAAGSAKGSVTPLVVPAGPQAVRVAGHVMALASPDAILVDFRNGEQAGPDGFARVRYASVLSGAPIFVAQTRRGNEIVTPGGWREPKAFFQNKIVFLDALASPTEETPVGTQDRRDVLAHALATLIAKKPLARAGNASAAWLTLLLAVWVGHLCVRRAPLDALWRVAPFVFGLLALAAVAFPVGWWVDPVAPLAGILGAFLLATQLTFGMERGERDYHRALLGRFLAPQVVDELLLRDPGDALPLGGKREQVCILFADVRNFTGFAETHTPEQVIETMNEYITVMTDALHAHRGILDKYTGDGLMALFRKEANPLPAGEPAGSGTEPRPHRALVARAVGAALDMQTAACALSRRRTLAGLPALGVGMGLHVGDAVVGLVGNPDRIVNYTALGYAVVVSARLQTVAAGGEVIVSEAVCGAVEGLFAVEARDPVSVKGVSAPVRPFRVLAAAAGGNENRPNLLQ